MASTVLTAEERGELYAVIMKAGQVHKDLERIVERNLDNAFTKQDVMSLAVAALADIQKLKMAAVSPDVKQIVDNALDRIVTIEPNAIQDARDVVEEYHND